MLRLRQKQQLLSHQLQRQSQQDSSIESSRHTHTHTHPWPDLCKVTLSIELLCISAVPSRQCQCFTSPQVAGYETLIRKIIKKAPKAALLSFASFMW
jgi:hypothetical protein